MSGSKATTWVVGTALLAVLVLFGAWSLLISPRLDEAAESRDLADSEQARIDQLEIQLVSLKQDFENLPALQDELAALQLQVPADAELAELTVQLADLAQATGVFITAVSPSTAIQVAPPAAAAEPAAPAEGEPAESETTSEAVRPAVPANLYAIPFEVRLTGSYVNTLAFLRQFQTQNPRVLLVRGVTLTGQEARAAEGALPATAEGDPETAIQAYAYVLRAAPAAATTGDALVDGDASATLPMPSGQENPFN